MTGNSKEQWSTMDYSLRIWHISNHKETFYFSEFCCNSHSSTVSTMDLNFIGTEDEPNEATDPSSSSNHASSSSSDSSSIESSIDDDDDIVD
jgi:hypothetical protein